MCSAEQTYQREAYSRESSDTACDTRQEFIELVQSEAVVVVGVVLLKESANIFEVIRSHGDFLLDGVDHDLPLAEVDLAVLVRVRFVHEVEEVVVD